MARKRTRHTLKSRSGHVEEQFSQMRTPLGVAQIFFDGFAPAAAQSAANHFSHGRFGLTAFFVWRVIHGHRDVTDHQRGVHREANLHVVNRLQRLPCAFAGNIKQFRFGIAHVGFNVPQTIVTLVAMKRDFSGVGKLSRLGGRQRQNG